MKYTLRDYQRESVDRSIKHLTKPKPAPFLVQLATGAGKSIIIAEVAYRLQKKTLVLQPSKELVEQNYSKLMSYEPEFDVGIYSASAGRKDIGLVTYATIGSIVNKPELFMDVEIIIMDECHYLNPEKVDSQYRKFFDAIGCKRVMGLTATPYRNQQRFYFEDGQKYYTSQLAMINRIYPFFYKSIIYKVETDELISRGYLAPILYRDIDIGDMDEIKVNTTGAEYTQESLEKFWNNDDRLKRLASVIGTVDKHCQRNLIFCSSLLQARRAREMLSEMGIRAEMVDGTTPDKERARLVQSFKEGEFKHMLNVGVFTTGFDVPELDCVTLGRATMSLALYYQMVGRGVRLDPARPDKKLRVYDLVRLHKKLGRVETIKIEKEIGENGRPSYKDIVVSEMGLMSGVPLFNFAVNK